MAELFKDIPEALENTNKLIDSIESPELKRDIVLPNYTIPPEFSDMKAYLRHLSYG